MPTRADAPGGVAAPGPEGDESRRPPRRRARHLSVAAVLVVGALITAGLSAGANAVHDSNENRLLHQRAREVDAVVGAALPSLGTPLTTAAVVAELTNGNPAAVRLLTKPLVGPKSVFTSVSLWRVGRAVARPLVVVGSRPALASEPQAEVRSFLDRAATDGMLTLNNRLATPERLLGYATAASPKGARYVVYGERVLPKNRRSTVDKNSAFSDLGYALYLGSKPDPRFLVASSTGGGLLHGRRASDLVSLGDSKLLIVITPHKELGGTLLAELWWILAALGLVLTVGAAALVGRLTRGRDNAERLARENERLYAEQRSVAQTLQHSLLAEELPDVGGLDLAARYVAGVEGIDVGGDWYDVVRLDRGNILVVVGDVSGRGLEAATMMASLRFAARAYAIEGHSPAAILSKLSALVSIGRDGHFATVLCGLLDVAAGRVTVANAGHPEPLLLTPSGADYVATNVGVPVGVDPTASYTEVEFSFPRGATLLLYTDGAIERRGERLDVGLQRLKDVSSAATGPLGAFLTQVVGGVVGGDAVDDTALLGLRWQS